MDLPGGKFLTLNIIRPLAASVDIPNTRIRKYTLPIFIQRANEIHNSIYDYTLIKEEDVKNAYSSVNIRCRKCGHIWLCVIHNHISRKSGCSNCSRKLRWTHNRLLRMASEVHGDAFDYSRTQTHHIQNVDSYIYVTCKLCLHEFTPTIDNHINGKSGCPSCAGNLRWNYIRLMSRAREIHGNLCNYDKVPINEIWTKESIIIVRCNICQRDWDTSIANHIYNRSGCRYCNMSVGENAILNILLKWGINPIVQATIPPLSNKPYDFVFTYAGKSYIVEFDGAQHFKFIPFFHDNEAGFRNRQEIDIEKTNHAIRSGYYVIRIDYTQLDCIEQHIITALNSSDRIYLSTPIIYEHIINHLIMF